jgi:hypothetical protein
MRKVSEADQVTEPWLYLFGAALILGGVAELLRAKGFDL